MTNSLKEIAQVCVKCDTCTCTCMYVTKHTGTSAQAGKKPVKNSNNHILLLKMSSNFDA